jgi:hypothetical protein
MNPIRIRTIIKSDTLQLPELRPWVGKSVEIIVLEDDRTPSSTDRPLRGSILRDDDPFGPAVPADEWEAAR